MGINPKNGYYWLRDILGYNCKYNLVLSDRGRGKSVEAKRFLIMQEGTAMCLFRQQPDMSHAMKDWTDPLINLFGYEYENFDWLGNDKEGWKLIVNGKPKIWFRYLTQVNNIKQEVFPDDMNWVWFDEFIPLAYKKLGGIDSEGDAIRTIIKTIEHDTVRTREQRGLKPLRFIGFANPFTWNNPLLSYWGILPMVGIHRFGKDVVCELMEPSKNSSNVDEIDKNNGWMNETAFIAKVPKNATPFESLRIGKMYFGIYEYQRKYYVKRKGKHINVSRMLYFDGKPKSMTWGTLDGLTESELCLENYNHLDIWKKYVYKGLLCYDNINTKFEFMQNI